MSRNSDQVTEDLVPAPEPSWEAFKSTRLEVRDPQPDWTRHQIPQELQTIDNVVDLPEKLKQILAWSLILRTAESATNAGLSTLRQNPEDRNLQTVQTDTSGRSDHATAESSSKPPVSEHRGTDDTPDDSRNSPNSSASGNTSDTYSVRSEQSSRILRVKPRYVGNGVFASALDLLASLKGRSATQPPSRANSKHSIQNNRPLVECTSCLEDIPDNETSKLPCNHSYCKPCLTMLITTALQNESSFPPKCCLTEIPLQTILASLDAKQRSTYKEKAAEFSVAPQERLYCPNSKCSKWIRPSKLFRIPALNERCPHCATKVCTVCRGLAHKSSADCPQDFGLEATIALAEQEGWRRCLKCRTLVERSQGCRHMTCKCGAQFCYTCGAKWRTCSCTETDEVNRQAELRRRRGALETARDAEAAEIARIIAQVEQMERRNARERRREEERRAEEQRREEAELARLEELRLWEEEAVRLEEARLEEDLRRILRVSVEESRAQLQNAWNEVRQTQMRSLDSKHSEAERRHAQACEEAMRQQNQENETTFHQMASNVERRTATMKERHMTELAAFSTELQDLEDDLFLEIQMHLRGKQDREARERRLRERFQKQYEGKQQELLAKHEIETKAFQANITMEMQGLRLVNQSRMANVEHKFRVALASVLETVAMDRSWFEFLSRRRQSMIAAHGRLMLEALEADQEPVGLTEETATGIGPFLTEVQDGAEPAIPGSSAVKAGTHNSKQGPWKETLSPSPTNSTSPARSFVELAATSQQLLNMLDPLPAPLSTRRTPATAPVDQLQSNSAFAWMTGALNDNTARKHDMPINRSQGLTRSRAISRRGRPQPHLAGLSPTTKRSELAPVSSWPIPPSDAAAFKNSTHSWQSSRRPLQIPEEVPTLLHASELEVPAARLPLPPTISAEPQRPAHETHQARVLGGLVPVTTSQEKRAKLIHAVRHRRQASSTSSFSNSSTTSGSSATTAPRSPSKSAASSPSSPSTSSSTISRSSGDSIFLHSLITSVTSTATAGASPSTAIAASVSPVSPLLPGSPSARKFEVQRLIMERIKG